MRSYEDHVAECLGTPDAPILCLECKTADPEPGCDHRTACLAKLAQPEIAANNSGRFLKLMADLEADGATLPSGPLLPDHGIQNLAFGPLSLVTEIASACHRFSDPTHEVVAHVYSVNGKPVVSLRREARVQGLDALLRHGSDRPLFRKQAS